MSEYLRRLVQEGFRVAICEQVEDPKFAKGIVRRAVVETVTPGAVFSDDLLDGARNNYLCAIQAAGTILGVAAVDVSTGEFQLIIAHQQDIIATLARLSPREVLVSSGDGAANDLVHGLDVLLTEREAWEFDAGRAAETLADHFAVRSLEGFGISEDDALAIGAAGALMRYLRELLPGGVPHLARPVVERPGGTMPIDEMTRRNLELVESLRGGDRRGHTACRSRSHTNTDGCALLAAMGAGAAHGSGAGSNHGSTRSTRSCTTRSRAPPCALRSKAYATWSGSRERPQHCERIPASSARSAIRFHACRRWKRLSAGCT